MAGIGFSLKRNAITPQLKRLIASVKPPARRRILRAMGTTFLSITQGNFNPAGSQYRPVAWPNKKDGKPATLKKSGALAHSFHLTVTDEQAVVSNPMRDAAIHQFGGQTKAHVILPKNKKALAFGGKVYARVNHPGSKMPARPFFPVVNEKLTRAAELKIAAAARRVLSKIK